MKEHVKISHLTKFHAFRANRNQVIDLDVIDHDEISHLTKFHAFRVNRDEVMDPEAWFKIHTNVSKVETSSPKTI